MTDKTDITDLPTAMFRALRAMDDECPEGLCNYVSMGPWRGKQGKEEASMTWGLTRALNQTGLWRVPDREQAYPGGGGRCDRVVQLADASWLWLEIKRAWRAWYFGHLKRNPHQIYRGYLSGSHHTHSFAGDFHKLERIGPEHGRYLGLLLIGFDLDDAEMQRDVAAVMRNERVADRGWQSATAAWQTAQCSECWIRCWFCWRETLVASPAR